MELKARVRIFSLMCLLAVMCFSGCATTLSLGYSPTRNASADVSGPGMNIYVVLNDSTVNANLFTTYNGIKTSAAIHPSERVDLSIRRAIENEMLINGIPFDSTSPIGLLVTVNKCNISFEGVNWHGHVEFSLSFIKIDGTKEYLGQAFGEDYAFNLSRWESANQAINASLNKAYKDIQWGIIASKRNAGNLVSRTNNIPKPPSNGIRRIAIIPLTAKNTDQSTADILSDILTSQLKSTSNFRVLERNQVNLILQEQGFQRSGACDSGECAIQIGKLLSVDCIITGSIGKLGNTFIINAKSVDVGSGELITVSSREYSGEINKITGVMKLVAADLAQR